MPEFPGGPAYPGCEGSWVSRQPAALLPRAGCPDPAPSGPLPEPGHPGPKPCLCLCPPPGPPGALLLFSFSFMRYVSDTDHTHVCVHPPGTPSPPSREAGGLSTCVPCCSPRRGVAGPPPHACGEAGGTPWLSRSGLRNRLRHIPRDHGGKDGRRGGRDAALSTAPIGRWSRGQRARVSDLSSDPRDPLTCSIGFRPGPGQVWGAELRDTAPTSPSYPGQQSTGRSSPGSAGLSTALHRPARSGRRGWHDDPAGLRPGSQGHGSQVAGTVPEKQNLRPGPVARPGRGSSQEECLHGRRRAVGSLTPHGGQGRGPWCLSPRRPVCRGLGAWPQVGTGAGGGVGVGTWVSQSPGPCVGRGEGRGQGGQTQWAEQVAGGAHGEGQPSGVLAVIPLGLGSPSLPVGSHPRGDPPSAPPSRGPCPSW